MGPVPSQYVDQNQGLAVPVNDRIPWSAWSSTVLQQNINNGYWQPWNFVCFENKNSEHQQNAQLSEKAEFFSSKVSSFGEIQTKPEDFVTDQSVCLQSSFNENRFKNINNSNLSMKGNFPRRKKTKNRKQNSSKSGLKQVASNGTVSSSPGPLNQSCHQKWNHVPVFEWLQSNALRPADARLQYPIRFGSVSRYSKYSDRFHNPARCEFTGRNLKSMPKRSRVYYRSDNYFARCKKVNFNSRTIYTKCPNETKMDEKKGLVSSATSTKSDNSKEEDDVEYLFSVDSSSEAKMILEIDLQSDGVNLIPNSNSSSKSQESKNKEEQSIIIIEEPELNGPLTRKRKLSISNKETNKRPSYRVRCSACKMSYDDVTEKKENMYISSTCSHVFCGPCVSKNEKFKVCPVCKVNIFSFRKLYR